VALPNSCCACKNWLCLSTV